MKINIKEIVAVMVLIVVLLFGGSDYHIVELDFIPDDGKLHNIVSTGNTYLDGELLMEGSYTVSLWACKGECL